MKQSIWVRNAGLQTFPRPEGNLTTDILVVGGGLAGLLCARRLTDLGADCVLIDAEEPFRGVSANTTAKITSQHGLIYHRLVREFGVDAARQYYEANQQAIAEYRRLAEEADCDFDTKDNYIYSTAAANTLDAELAALMRIGAAADFHTRLSLPIPVTGAIRFPDQGQFNPVKLAAGISRGLRIYSHTPAREFMPGCVRTDYGTIRAEKILVATHFPILNKHGGFFLKMHQQRSYLMALENAPEVTGMYLDSGKAGVSFRSYGKYLLLGGGGHRTGKSGGGWTALEDFCRQHFPDAREVCRWAAQDCMTLDGMPYIGRYSPATPGLYVATGFNKWGMTSAMVSAMILAELMQGKSHPWAWLFDPGRSVWRRELASNMAESVWNLLTPTAPRCPHLGCALKWNPGEHSWDCPCHGSRFDAAGRLLDNPAMGNAQIRKDPP